MGSSDQTGRRGPEFGPTGFFTLSVLVLGAFILIFRHFLVSPLQTLLFAAGLFGGVYLPGLAACRLLKIQAGRLETTTLALVIGMTSTTLVYRVFGMLGARWAIWIWLGGSAAVLLVRLRSNPLRREDFRFRLTPGGAGFGLLAAVVAGTQVLDNFRNGLRLPQGSVRLFLHYFDGFTRNTLVRELSHAIPPQMSFAAGLPISYHYDMNLFAAIFYRHLGLGVLDLLHRFTLAFYFAVLMLACFVFIRRWTKSEGTALLGTTLVVFGSGGFAWVVGLLTPYPSVWGKMFYSMYYLDLASINPILPALGILFAGLYALNRYFDEGGGAWLFLSGYFLAIISGYKMTFTVPVLAALGGTGVLYLAGRGDRAAIKAFSVSAALTAPFIVMAAVHNTGGPPYVFRIAFNDWIIFPFLEAELMGLASAWGDIVRGIVRSTGAIGLAVLAVVIFTAGAFGPALTAVPSMVREGFALRKGRALDVFLTALFFAGVILFFMANPTFGDRSRNWLVVDLIKMSALVLIVVWSARVGAFASRRKGAVAVLAVIAALALSVPNVVQFIEVKHRVPDPEMITADFMGACEYLNERSDPDAVILHSGRIQFVPYFADRRVVLDSSPYSYLHHHLTPDQYEERTSDRARFFADPAVSGDVLEKYRVSHVWVKRREDARFWVDLLPEIVDCPPYRLRLAYRSFRHALFRVEPGAEGGED